jgi:hypothetical protein
MAEGTATGTVIAAGVIVTGSTLVRDVHEGKGRAAPIIFGFMMVSALLIISMASTKYAKGLAYLSMVGAFVVNGPAVFSITSGITGSEGKPVDQNLPPLIHPKGTSTGGRGVTVA